MHVDDQISTSSRPRTTTIFFEFSYPAERVSECWRFYAVSTAKVIFTAKTSLDVFSLSREQVWTFSSLG